MNYKSKKYPEYVFPTKAKLYITQNIKDQIDFLHHKVGNFEWSGFLFYTILKGELSKPSTLEIQADDIFLLDIGSTTHTAATISSEDLIEMYENIPGAEEGKKYGLIHTHHNMDTFFSGTDVDELHDNVGKHNFYLSLIVNNAGKYCAKMVFLAKKKLCFKDLDDKLVESEEEVMVTIDFNIVYPVKDWRIPTTMTSRFQRIQEASKKPTYTYSSGFYSPPIYQSPATSGQAYARNSWKSSAKQQASDQLSWENNGITTRAWKKLNKRQKRMILRRGLN